MKKRNIVAIILAVAMVAMWGIKEMSNIKTESDIYANYQDVYNLENGNKIKLDKFETDENGDKITPSGNIIYSNGVQKIGGNIYLPKNINFSDVGIVNKSNQEQKEISSEDATKYKTNNIETSEWTYGTNKQANTKVGTYTGIYNANPKDDKRKILEKLGIDNNTIVKSELEENSANVYIFPEEEIFYYSYSDAVNHAIDLYNAGKNSRFYRIRLTNSPTSAKWPNDTNKQQELLNNGLEPKENNYIYE